MPERDAIIVTSTNNNGLNENIDDSGSTTTSTSTTNNIESNEVIPSISSSDKLLPDGIVITDKMSDFDIVRSLYHLEQNYLASMGLATDTLINFGLGIGIKSGKQQENNQSDKKYEHETMSDADLKDEYITATTVESYHGINGTVVGWGWIKDIDMSELVNKGKSLIVT